MEQIKKVLANVSQNLTEAEKLQARTNIGAAGAGDVPANAVLYTEQTLQDYQKAQARQNINAATGDLVTQSTNGLMSSTDKTKLDGIEAGAEVNVQSDWNQANNTADDYIKNKPANLVQDASYVHTDNNFTTTLKDKLDGIAAGAEVNVQSDWSQIDTSADDYIKNKPNLATVATSGSYTDLSNTPTIPAAQVNSDWNASSGVAQILNKPSLTEKPYGGSATALTSLNFDFDDPEGYVGVGVNGGNAGSLVAGPYASLLNSGVSGVGDSSTPIYIDSSGVFQSCSIKDAEWIQFNYSNTTTAQDDVYTAVVNAYTAHKIPILYCGVANGSLYWFPTAVGANGYSFSRNTDTYAYILTVDSTSHVITHSSKEIKNYTAGSNISISANDEISATDTTYTGGSGIEVTNQHVINNTHHIETNGVLVLYSTLANAGTTNHSFGPWRIQLTKKAMVTWDSTDDSIILKVGHSNHLDGSIDNGALLMEPYYPWKDGTWADVYVAHSRWGFTGAYDSGPSNGIGLNISGPTDADNYNRTMPKKARGYKLRYNCGMNKADWLDLTVNFFYVNNNTSLSSNSVYVQLQAIYFYG